MAAQVGYDRDRASNDADVSSIPPFIPTVSFPVRLEEWHSRQCLPGASVSFSLLPKFAVNRPICIALRVFRGRCVRFDTPVLGQQAVTTQREVQNAFKSLFADTDNASDLKNLYVNRLLQHILQPFDRL